MQIRNCIFVKSLVFSEHLIMQYTLPTLNTVASAYKHELYFSWLVAGISVNP